jgi:hypothetical protein
MTQPSPGDREELAVGRDVHDRLGDGERDDLRVRHAAPGVSPPPRQEIVGRGEHGSEQQVEVGEHRGPPGSTARIGTADFDPPRYVPYSTPQSRNHSSSAWSGGQAMSGTTPVPSQLLPVTASRTRASGSSART